MDFEKNVYIIISSEGGEALLPTTNKPIPKG